MKAIITFHSIDERQSVLSFPARKLERLLDGFERAGIAILKLDALLDPATRSGVALTFDDGMSSLHSAALDILSDRDVPAHLFLVTGAVAKSNQWPGQPGGAEAYDMLNWHQIEEVQAKGVTIEAHTHSHPDMRQLSDAAIGEEFERCDSVIEARTGVRPSYFAYPYGFCDARTQRLAGAHYKGAVTTRMGGLSRAAKLEALPRLDSYYLQPDWLLDRPASKKAQAYLSARAQLRKVRGMVWNSDHA